MLFCSQEVQNFKGLRQGNLPARENRTYSGASTALGHNSFNAH